MSQLHRELDQLKEVFQSSTESQDWEKSDRISHCTDQEFDYLLKRLRANELEAAVLILQRNIDLEKQIWKCLENLKSVLNGRDDKLVEVNRKLISSQWKVARLRSKLLRCIIQQLRCKGSTDAYLPPWSGIDVANNENEDFQHQAEIIGQQGVGVNGQTLFAGQNTNNESTGVNVNPEDLTYSNVEDASTATNVKGQMQKTLPEQEPEPESIYEISPPSSPSKSSSPFKPLPYSVSKKGKKRQANAGDGEEKPEGTYTKQDVPAPCDNQLDEEDAWVVEKHHLQDWDPTPVLQELFANVQSPSSSSLQTGETGVDNVRMAGYMEKLPVKSSHKKGSMFKSWKKRHFKAAGGKLFYYEDHRALEPLGSINLIDCVVTKVEDKLLEVVEEGGEGKSVKLKCSSTKEAEDWKEALQAESAVPMYTNVPTEELSAKKGLTIIIDLGSSSVKAGFARENAWPQVIFPCVIAADKEDPENFAYGFSALLPEIRKNSKLRFPLRKSLKIDMLKFNTLDLIGIFEHVFDKLKVDPSEHKVIMTMPHASGPQEKEELVELLLDHFQVEACYLQEQAVLAMYSYSAISGIVVDIGDHIDIFPVEEGCMIEAGVTRLPYGGRQITDAFTRMLTETGLRLFSEVESYLSRAIKEKVSFVAKREEVEDEIPDCAMVVNLETYSIPDGTREVAVDAARYRCTEGLFRPSLWGKDHPGIHQLTVKAIMACSIDMRKQMCRNIYLSGGGSMSPGLAERLQAEVSELVPFSQVQVHAGEERYYAAFIGASVVASLPMFNEMFVTKEEWDDLGPEALQKW